MTETFIENVYEKFNYVTKKPEKLLSAPEKLIDNIKDLIKETYDFTKKQEETSLESDALPSLIVENFDLEQIWQQIELQNNSILTEYLTSVSRLVAAKEKLWFLNIADEDNIDDENKSEDNSDDESVSNENEAFESNESDNNEQDIQNDSISSDKENEVNGKVKIKHKSIVDDDFFKLNEMEEFLKKEEQNSNKKPKDTEDSEDEESVDLFDMKSDEDLDNDSEEDESKMNPKYDEFFGENVDQNNDKKRKRLHDEELDSDDNEIDESEDGINNKSSLELREERLHKKIKDIEDLALQEKSWQLKGEITADKRPQNSLLEEIVDFDMTLRPAPVITEETTYKLEDIIKKRIKDKVWDDVERKTKLVETPLEYKKKLMLDQEKSKQSLAQIYEHEYLKQKEALNPDSNDKPDEEPKEHLEIKSMMKSLFGKLDALSNFHFTPKSAVPELRIISNLPAINMEEVAPVAVSDATLLAPEEIKNKPKGDIIGKGERTKTDKKRERRQKKLKQREHAKEKLKKEKLIEKMRPGLGNKYSKQKAAKLLDKITKDKNVDKMDETLGSSGVKSSTAFFSQLQDEVRSNIKEKKVIRKDKPKQTLIAKKLKL